MDDPKLLTIGKFAYQGGVTAEAIRYYERRGLLPAPSRARSGYRLYADNAIRRLRFIKRAQLYCHAQRPWHSTPLVLAIVASIVVLAGKFDMENGWMTAGGAALLIAAVLLGGRKKSAGVVSCPACATDRGQQRAKAH